MSKPVVNVALVCGPDCDMESQAVRATLEYFGARVFMYWVGRPNDFISVLSGDDLYVNTDLVILNFHGNEGKFVMPELGDDIYEEGEPGGDFGPHEISSFANLEGKVVFGNGCSLGDPALAKAFLNAGCRIYIGPDDYPNGNDALMFILRSFYEIIEHGKDIKEAYEIASTLSVEMSMYKYYEHG
ncbi:delta-aminolevulinic acid dehydratase [Paenibacillus sp. FSL L8-0158]|uniref:delta-aminolevulinic acid dehydratase n=1 Tax=Paenibacillus sp. FSL L8-0158 TaxID=2954752 RepID=UPI0031593A69